MKGSEEFKNTCPLAWENICNDSELTKEKIEEFTTYLDAYTDGDIKEYAKDFFHNDENIFLGSEIPLDTEEVFGRFIEEGAMISHLVTILNISAKRAKELISFWIEGLDQDSQLDAIKGRVGDKKINAYLMWSFRNLKDKFNPLNSDVDFDDMPCVLGLKGKNLPFICITHKIPDDIKIHCPTAFNAGVDSASYAWEPGGKTIPLPECNDKYIEGLPEVVHEPNNFNHLHSPIVRLD